jgi:hypothetical protein
MTTNLKFAALAFASASMLSTAMPASATSAFAGHSASSEMTGVSAGWNHGRRQWDQGEYHSYDDRGYVRRSDYYDGPVWRGRDGRYHCRRNDGTTGLLIGGAVGGVLGHGIAGRGDRTAGTILGIAGGALIGRAIDRSGSRCN